MRALGKGSIAEIMRVGLLLAWVILWVCAALLIAVTLAYALNTAGLVDLREFFSAESRFHLDTGDGVIAAPANGATWPVVVPVFLIGAVAITGGLMIVWRLRKLFDSFCSGQPFAKENATHLRAIWMTMVGIEVARYLLLGLTVVLLTTFGGVENAALNLKINLSTWASILILIVLAEVFREGARLKREQELTI